MQCVVCLHSLFLGGSVAGCFLVCVVCVVAVVVSPEKQAYIKRRSNFFVTDSGFETCFGWERWDPAPRVLGSDSEHISNPEIAGPILIYNV